MPNTVLFNQAREKGRKPYIIQSPADLIIRVTE